MVLWVFGYGSLIWRPSFSYDERVVGYIKGYHRVFHQACIDHRGTIHQPGRTLTLEEKEGAITWGVAYRVTAHVEEQMAKAYLNQRERTYNVRALLEFYTADCSHTPAITEALTYIATSCSSNMWYLGPAPLAVMAKQIAESRGPAGANYDYLFRLEESLHQIGPACVDDEIVALANAVRKVLRARKYRHRKKSLQRTPRVIGAVSEFSKAVGIWINPRIDLATSHQCNSGGSTGCKAVMVRA